MIHLDTHVVLWLNRGETGQFNEAVRSLLATEVLRISPMVEFELEVLHEIGRSAPAATVLADLRRDIGLQIDPIDFAQVSAAATTQTFSFTRDPFDRLIAAHAYVAGVELLTQDRNLRSHLDFAVWG